MALPLGEAGIAEIPNESPVLSAMQSNIGDKTGLYIFPALGVSKNATREEKRKAMKQMQQRIAANLSGIRWSYCCESGARQSETSVVQYLIRG